MTCECANPKDFGAIGDGIADDTAAIQNAIDSQAQEICFPPGNYLHGDLTLNNEYQSLIGFGARLVRTSPTATITIAARGVTFWGFRISGGSLSGTNLTISSPDVSFFSCSSMDTYGRPLLAQDNGGNLMIVGGVWNTLDHTSNGYDIELKDTTAGTSLYSKIIGVVTQQGFGGLLIDGQGTVKVSDSQFGKLTILAGGGAFVSNRIIGAVSVQSSASQFENNAFASHIAFGNGSGSNISNITFGPTNIIQAGNTLTIGSDVIESAFHLNQLANTTLIINGPNNDIWHGRIPYVPTIAAAGGSPALGNGMLTGGFSRAGREVTIDLNFIGGTTTNYGATEFYFTSPFKSGRDSLGAAIVTDGGVRNYSATATVMGGDNKIRFLAADSGGEQNIGASYPFLWGDGDFIRAQISIPFAP